MRDEQARQAEPKPDNFNETILLKVLDEATQDDLKETIKTTRKEFAPIEPYIPQQVVAEPEEGFWWALAGALLVSICLILWYLTSTVPTSLN